MNDAERRSPCPFVVPVVACQLSCGGHKPPRAPNVLDMVPRCLKVIGRSLRKGETADTKFREGDRLLQCWLRLRQRVSKAFGLAVVEECRWRRVERVWAFEIWKNKLVPR